LFESQDDWRKYIAACQLYDHDNEKLRYMIDQFRNQEPAVREALILGLTAPMIEAGRGSEDLSLEPPFLIALEDDAPQVRTAAAVGLRLMGSDDAIERLEERLVVEEDARVRETLESLL
jgi:hypothetical protein